MQPIDTEVGAGTSHTATFLRALGPEPWRAAYVQPSRRPKDARYGENPNRLHQHHQFQVVIKPSPTNIVDLYLGSLRALGIDILWICIWAVSALWALTRKSMTSALWKTTGKTRRWAPGGWAGKFG